MLVEPLALRLRRLPFFYGWVIVGIAFVTMAISVTSRTAFSLLLPPLVEEFSWDRGMVAGAFSFGFLVSAVLSPVVGRLIDRHGPRVVIELGALLLGSGLLAAMVISQPWHLYLTLGVLVGGGANCMSYTAQSLFLPNWFVRRRGLAIGIAFAGVGVGGIVLLPWVQTIIQQEGWRAACLTLGMLALVVLVPINLFVWLRPENLGLRPDGDPQPAGGHARKPPSNVVDHEWAATEWTLGRAIRTARFWWIMIGFFCCTFAWYAVQVHQTKYLIEIGFDPLEAAWALGLVSIVAIPGQIALGALSDRIGREWVWTAGCAGFALCYAALIGLEHHPTRILLYGMVIAQGLLGYSVTSVMGPIVAEIFDGPHYGTIFGTLTIGLIGGGAAGPLAAGIIHDVTGSYQIAFVLAFGCCVMSAIAIGFAAPRTVRLVPGKAR
ncbi:MAG: MFS transporter [Burkholderiales bacterium]